MLSVPVPTPVSQPVLRTAPTFAAALGPELLMPALRKRMVVPLAARPPMAPRTTVPPTVAEGITVMTLAPRTAILTAPKVSGPAVVAAVASRTSSPPCRVNGRVDPMRFGVSAPLTTVSLPLERRVMVPVPPRATPLTKVLPARISIAPVIAVLATLKLTVPVPYWVKPPVLAMAAVPKLMTPVPRGLVTQARLVPAAMPPLRLRVAPDSAPMTAPAVPMVRAPPIDEALPARPRSAPP